MYNKLFTKILDSSIWLEPMATRIVWLTFIAVMDEDGFVAFAAPANVAHRARVELPDAEAALAALEAPDPNSSDPDNEGRRIERVPGGWMVLNSEKYRAMTTKIIIQEQTRKRVARHRAKLKGVTECNASVTQANDPVTPSVAVAVAAAKRERKRTTIPTVDEVIAHGAMAGVSEADCRAWFKDRESEGWADRDGIDIGNWRRWLNGWRDKQRANHHENRSRTHPANAPKPAPDYSKGF